MSETPTICPGCANPISASERLTGLCGKDGSRIDRPRVEVHLDLDDTLARFDAEGHVNYPHFPGRLYDCPACEAKCHCVPGETECVFEGEHSGVADG